MSANEAARDLRSMDIPGLEAFMAELGEPSYRAGQIFDWLHKKKALAVSEMTNLPAALRNKLNAMSPLRDVSIEEKFPSSADDACKYLLRLGNDTIIESVLMKHRHGNTLCVSTQAGCRMGCKFCASTAAGLQRNLTAGEICSQVYAAERDSGRRVDSVVLMGCGEPLDNFDNVIRFLRLISHPLGANIGIRHITLSTCGLAREIYRLAELDIPVTLAVSLHAPDDETRKILMPSAKKYSVSEIMKASGYYAEMTGRRVTFEYILISGVNDGDAQAEALCALLRGMLCHVNLLRLNAANGGFKQSGRTDNFLRILKRRGIPATARHSLGGDVNAACGQLRNKHILL